jgi:hypothetical protein
VKPVSPGEPIEETVDDGPCDQHDGGESRLLPAPAGEQDGNQAYAKDTVLDTQERRETEERGPHEDVATAATVAEHPGESEYDGCCRRGFAERKLKGRRRER